MDAGFGHGVTGLPRDEAVRRAVDAAETAVRAEPGNYFAVYYLSNAYRFAGDRDRFYTEADRFLSMGWRSNILMGWQGYSLANTGRWDLGTAIIRKAIGLCPGRYPRTWHYTLGNEAFIRDDYETALEEFYKGGVPGYWYNELMLAKTYGAMGQIDKARSHVTALLDRRPDFTAQSFVNWRKNQLWDEELTKKSAESLIKSGLPTGGYGA